MKPPLKELPAVPTGYEHFDLLWSQLIPDAAIYVAILPREADPAWATAEGLRFVAISLLKQWAAHDELARTPSHSTLRRVRARHLQLLERQHHGQALTLVAALVDQAREAYPRASAAQLLTVARDGFKALLGTAFRARKHESERGHGAEMTTWLQAFSFATRAAGAEDLQGLFSGVFPRSP